MSSSEHVAFLRPRSSCCSGIGEDSSHSNIPTLCQLKHSVDSAVLVRLCSRLDVKVILYDRMETVRYEPYIRGPGTTSGAG